MLQCRCGILGSPAWLLINILFRHAAHLLCVKLTPAASLFFTAFAAA